MAKTNWKSNNLNHFAYVLCRYHSYEHMTRELVYFLSQKSAISFYDCLFSICRQLQHSFLIKLSTIFKEVTS